MSIEDIGLIIKERRSMFNLRQEDLSEISGIGVRTIHQIERGIGNPSYTTLEKLMKVLGLDFSVQVKQAE